MKQNQIFRSAIGIILALSLFTILLFLFNYTMNLFHKVDGLLDKLSHDIIPAAMATYISLYLMNIIIKRYNKLFVFIGFSIIQQSFFFIVLLMVLQVNSPLYDIITTFLHIPFCYLLGFYAYKKEMNPIPLN